MDPDEKYLIDAFRLFINDPPDTEFQRGYLWAFIEMYQVKEFDETNEFYQQALKLGRVLVN